MPELPDVEIFKRYVDSTSLHQKMTGSLAYFKNPDDEPPHSNKGSTF
jgi:hypothetical protein